MAYGDGIAQGIDTFGMTVITSNDGYAVGINCEEYTIVKNISPLSDSKCEFVTYINTRNEEYQNTIIMNPLNIRVDSKVKDKKYIYPSQNKLITLNISVTQKVPYANNVYIDVMDKGDIRNHLIPYLSLRDTCLHIDSIQVIQYDNDIIINNPSFSIGIDIDKLKNIKTNFILNNSKQTFISVTDTEYNKINIDDVYISVQNAVSSTKSTNVTVEPIVISVEDYKPPVIGTVSNGGGLKGFRMVLQKQSYYEQYLSFTDGSVKDITGLPMGMIFDGSYLKGTPTISGRFAITIRLDNNSVISGLLIVSQVPRHL